MKRASSVEPGRVTTLCNELEKTLTNQNIEQPLDMTFRDHSNNKSKQKFNLDTIVDSSEQDVIKIEVKSKEDGKPLDSLTSHSKDFEAEDSPEKRRETIIKKSYYKALKELDQKIEQRRKWELNLVKNTIPKCVLNT